MLLFAYGLRDVPVDTHVSRVGTRLGLLRPGAPFEELHDQMLALTPPGQELELHVNLLRHGRRTCHARRPPAASARWRACARAARSDAVRAARAAARSAGGCAQPRGSTAKAMTAYCSAAAAITSAWKTSW